MNEAIFGRNGPLLVCVDGSEDGMRALRYATFEAQRLGCVLHVVHVVQGPMPMAPMLPTFSADTLRSVGLNVLHDAAQAVERQSGDAVVVEEVLAHGPRVSAILSHADVASGIVIGQRTTGVRRALTGSTTTGVIARATVPVTCVPAAWTSDTRHGRVVVGIASPASAVLLAPALFLAHQRGDRLTLLHAWSPEGPYDSAIGGRVLADTWERESEQALWELLAGERAAFPDVEVDVDLRYERPSVALTDASKGADLLVLGRRAHGNPPGLAVGSHVRALVRNAHCPIEVLPLPEPAAPEATASIPEQSGEHVTVAAQPPHQARAQTEGSKVPQSRDVGL